MQNPSKFRRIQRPAPTSRGAGRAFLWMAAGPLACLALLVGVAFGTWAYPIESERQFEGVLRPVATPIGVDLPEHAVLQQIVVSQGDVVREGQTLALLDLPEMRLREEEILREILLARIERLCLTANTAEDYDLAVTLLLREAGPPLTRNEVEAPSLDPAALEEETQGARASCQLANAAWAATQAHHNAALEAKARQLALLEQQIAVLVERQGQVVLSPEETSALALNALQALMEKTSLEVALAEREAELEATRLSRAARRAEQAALLGQRISKLRREAQILDTLTANPRLAAPTTGIVTRLRDPGPGHRARTDERFIEVGRAGGKSFRLAVTVPPDEISRLRDGARVELKLAGALSAPPLDGNLDLDRQLLDPNAPAGAVMVNLSGRSRAWLSSPQGTLALGGGATASAVRLRFEAEAFGDVISRARADLRPKEISTQTYFPSAAPNS